MKRRIFGPAGFAAAALLTALVSQPASADLQRWSVLYLDGAGNPTSISKAKSAEIWAQDQRGYVLSIGCASDGGYSLFAQAPDGAKGDYGGPEIAPSFRVSKPGTDLFLGPVGKMTFNGTRYEGRLPAEAVAPLREEIKNGLVHLAEFNSRITIIVRSQRAEGALTELPCN